FSRKQAIPATITGRLSNRSAGRNPTFMAGKTYAVLGGGGSFGIHAAFYLLDHANPKKVIGIGRNPLRPEPFSLGIERRDGYVYHARHVTHELDLLLELLDREKPEVIINFAA